MTDWQPIETAPKTGNKLSGAGPLILLASPTGHRAVGYWGTGISGEIGWINPHDHLPMWYQNEFTHWAPIDLPPKETE